jgi:hypothetical protein
MEIIFKEKKHLPQGFTERIVNSLLKTLSRFKDKIRAVSVNVKDFNYEKPFRTKNLQVFITMNNGEKYFIQKSDSSLQTASQNMVKAVKGLMSNVINKASLEKRKRVPIYLYNQE